MLENDRANLFILTNLLEACDLDVLQENLAGDGVVDLTRDMLFARTNDMAARIRGELQLQRPKYLQEFPDYDDVLELPTGFADVSWHNDACPSMWSRARRVLVFCDYKDRSRSELAGVADWHRFSVSLTDEGGEGVMDLGGGMDGWAEVLERIEAVPELTDEQWAVVDALLGTIKTSPVAMAVVDYMGKIGTDPLTGEVHRVQADDCHRFGVRDLRHVEIYKLRVVALNDKARGLQ